MLDLKALLSKILNPPVAVQGNASGRINLFGLLIQWGSNTQAVSSSSTVSWNTTFGKAYAYTPILFTQIVNTSAPATFHVSANNITTTGCTWLRQSSASTSYQCTIHWIAIGFANGGGYLTTKFYEIFSHLERWWGNVRLKGFVGENTCLDSLKRVHWLRNKCGHILLHFVQHVYDTVRRNYTSGMHIQGKLLHYGDAKRRDGARRTSNAILSASRKPCCICSCLQGHEGLCHKVFDLQLRLLLPVYNIAIERGCLAC